MRKTVLSTVVTIVFAGFLICADGVFSPAAQAKTVTVTGEADGTDARAYDEALEVAMRRAVEKGAGTFISSRTEIEGSEVILDKILSQASGYIRDWKEVATYVEDGMTFVEIEASVSSAELEDDWNAFELLMERKGKPRLMVYIEDVINDEIDPSLTTKDALIERLQDKGFRVIDAVPTTEIKITRINMFETEMIEKISLFGKKMNADILVLGVANVDKTGEVDLYGQTAYTYAGNLRIKVVKADTSEVILTTSTKEKGNGLNEKDVAYELFDEMAKDISKKMITRITQRWMKDIQLGNLIHLVVYDMDFKTLVDFENALRNVRFVKDVVRRNYSENEANIEVEAQTLAQDLAVKLTEMEGFDVEIVKTSQNTIALEVAKQEPPEEPLNEENANQPEAPQSDTAFPSTQSTETVTADSPDDVQPDDDDLQGGELPEGDDTQ